MKINLQPRYHFLSPQDFLDLPLAVMNLSRLKKLKIHIHRQNI